MYRVTFSILYFSVVVYAIIKILQERCDTSSIHGLSYVTCTIIKIFVCICLLS